MIQWLIEKQQVRFFDYDPGESESRSFSVAQVCDWGEHSISLKKEEVKEISCLSISDICHSPDEFKRSLRIPEILSFLRHVANCDTCTDTDRP